MIINMTDDSLKILEERIGYRFRDRYLLECALTHTSFANEQKIQTLKDYERIEFLGDAVLEMISSGCASPPWLIAPGICPWAHSYASEKVKKPAEAVRRTRSSPMSWKP